jgi:uncharacterized protein involved in outer membrane biogenesis
VNKTVLVALIICLFFINLGVTKDQLAKNVIVAVSSGVLGAPVRIDGLSLGTFSRRVRVRGIRVYNPAGFGTGVLVYLPRVYITYDLLSFLRGRLHLADLFVELEEIGLVRNREGELNVDSLKVAAARNDRTAEPLALLIDSLSLRMGRLVFKDYSAKEAPPSVTVYEINLKRRYSRITSAQQLSALILSEPMKAVGIKGAAIYGVSVLAGVAVLPVAVAATLVGNDGAQAEFEATFDQAYETSRSLLEGLGRVTVAEKAKGLIRARVRSADVTLRLRALKSGTTQVSASCRQYFLPKPEIAGGIIYQISERLKVRSN